MFDLTLKIFLFLSPIAFLILSIPSIATLQYYQFGFFSNSIEVTQVQIFCYFSIFLLLASFVSTQQRKIKDKYATLIFFIFVVNVYLHPKTIKIFPYILFGFIIYYLVSIYASQRILKNVFKIIAFVSLLNTIFAMLQFFNIHLIYNYKGEIIGLMNYKTQLGIYQALAMPICYVLNPYLIIIPAIGLLLSKSVTSIFAALIGMAFLLNKKRVYIHNPSIWLCIFTVVGLLIYKNFHKIMIRVPAWGEAIKEGINKFFVGNGIGSFHLVTDLNDKYKISFTDPYSIYFQMFHALGVFGLLATLLFVFNMFKDVPRGVLNDGLIASCLIIAVSGIGYSFMDYPRLAGTAIVLLGLLNVVKQKKETLC